ncbi:MAG: branched-chain amino acid ABC transporter permease, partial [Burkholderiales bacterium]|nr:branched-chain amino acid ABC transporter permease [Burkholderiales bacterium]
RGATAAAEAGTVRDFVRPPGARFFIGTLVALGLLALLPWAGDDYAVVLATDCAIFALFAVSLHLLMGPGGMASFGHAAFFGIGAYGAALLAKQAGWPMLGALAMAPVAAAAFAAVVGWFSVRLSGVYLAMLTLAFAQIAWSIAYQWDDVTGGSNGLVGVWPAAAFSDKTRYFLLTLTLCGAGIVALWLIQRSAFGYALRAGRDAPRRADALGIAVSRVQWFAFPLAGAAAGLAGALYVFSKGSLAPDVMAISRSVDGLVMVLLGGLQTLTGPVVGAALFTWLQDEIIRRTDYWRLILGVAILAIVLAVPSGVVGGIARAAGREKA